jgi:hypothetical protein
MLKPLWSIKGYPYSITIHPVSSQGRVFLNFLTSAGGEPSFETGFLSEFTEGTSSLPALKNRLVWTKICYSIENMGVHHYRRYLYV